MTKFELFHIVAEGLLKQGCRSANGVNEFNTPLCLYRDPYGNKCAAGHAIDDKDYHPDMENLTICQVADDFDLPGLSRNLENLEMVRELQRLHDKVQQYRNVCVGDWPEHLYDIACQFGIEPRIQHLL